MVAQGPLVINEVMAAHHELITDTTGSAEDWIEVFNSGDSPISLAGYWISDDASQPSKHVFPTGTAALTIPANGHLLLWASGDPARGPDHLNFKISSSGEPIVLSSPLGDLMDLVVLGQQHPHVSFGRAGDGGETWYYFPEPTPGFTNALSGATDALVPPQFSVPAGFHEGPLQLTIDHPDPDAVIYYTLDGSIPTPELVAGHVFTYKNVYPNWGIMSIGEPLNDTLKAFVHDGPIMLEDPSSQPNLLSMRTSTAHHFHPAQYMPTTLMKKAVVVRARAYKDGHLPSRVVTNTYFLFGDDLQMELPVLSISTEREHLFGHGTGIYNPGIDYEDWKVENLNTTNTGDTPANWRRSTEFPMSMEWFSAGGTERTFHRDVGFRLHGAYSRMFRRKSFRLYFRERYGAPTLDHQMFPLQDDTGFKRLVVHTSANDDNSTNMRDLTLQAMVRYMRFETQDGQPAVVFLNGEYWGVHAMRERYDKHYFKRVLGLEENEIDVVERYRHASIGDSLHWSALLDLVADEDPAEPDVYEQIVQQVDVEDHIDYHLAQVFIGNFDWPQNNMKAYRKKTNGYIPGAPHGHDGRWRWLMYDTDWGFNLNHDHGPDSPYLFYATGGWAGDHTLLFRRLLRNTTYRNAYINRAADMANTGLRTEMTTAIIDHYKGLLEHDMYEHVRRWPNSPVDHADWLQKLDVMYAFSAARPQFFMEEMLDHFDLPAMHALNVDVSDTEAGHVQVNTIALRPGTYGVDEDPYPWNGTYFQDVPITLEAIPFPGWAFSHWEGDLQGVDSAVTVNMTADMSVTAVFSPIPYCAPETINYWHFNDLPGGGAIGEVSLDIGGGEASISYAGSGTGHMDATPDDEGSPLNALAGVAAGKGLRVRNPSNGRHLLITCPSTGHRDIMLSYAVRRTTAGADSQRVSYTVDPEQLVWHELESFAVPEFFVRKEYALTGIAETYDSPHLAFRIEFLGPAANGTSGNHRFDNIQLTGGPLTVIDAAVCDENETYTYGGVDHPPGDHLHINENAMDCDHLMMVRVTHVEHDTTITSMDGVLHAIGAASEYQWIDCNTMATIPDANDPQYAPEEEGEYAVILSSHGCEDISGCHHSPGGLPNGVNVHPNPSRDHVHLRLDRSAGPLELRLYDGTGRLIREYHVIHDEVDLDLSSEPRGIYLLLVRAPQARLEERVKLILE